MWRLVVVVLSVLVAGAGCGGRSSAQGGNGLYEPFPQSRAASQAQDFAVRLGVPATAKDLSSGVFVGSSLPPTAAVAASGPSGRAGVSVSTTGLAVLLSVALSGLGLAGFAAARRRRTDASTA
jgi:hypothetical protein